jgi:hypothetical protein
METGDLLRLAWEADHDGRPRLRDALLTLAVVESGPGDAWAERCRTRLVSDRPSHYLGRFATVTQALAHPQVIEARERLRVKYPAAKVRSLLLRACASRGPYLGRVESLEAMLEDLAGPSAEAENIRRDAPQPSRGPLNRQRSPRTLAWSLTFPPLSTGVPASTESRFPEPPLDSDEPSDAPSSHNEFTSYYLAVLLAIAFVLATVQQIQDGPGTRT